MRTSVVVLCFALTACSAPSDPTTPAPGPSGTVPGDILGKGKLSDHSDALPQPSRSTTDVQLVDLNNDGKLDIVWMSQDWPTTGDVQVPGKLAITMNDGGGHFHELELGDPDLDGSGWQFVLPLDLDKDGDVDLVLSRAARMKSEILVMLNDGTGKLAMKPDAIFPAIEGVSSGILFGRVTPIDVDKDGLVDLVVPIFGNIDYTVDLGSFLLMNKGGGQLVRDESQRLPPLPPGQGFTLSAAAGDVNGDGWPDIFLGAAERPQRILINDGTGRFVDQSDDDGTGVARLPSLPLRAYRSAMVDLNGDGALDVVVINDATLAGGPRQNQAFINDGTGHFTLGWMAPQMTAYDSRGLDFGDINRDGILDVVVGNATANVPNQGHALQVALGTGGGGFAVLDGMGPWSSGVFGVAVGDLNQDGFADVVGAVAEPDAATGMFRNILLLSDSP